jgi:hypothetical protein
MEGLKKDTRKIKYFLMKTLRTTRATTCRTFSIVSSYSFQIYAREVRISKKAKV